MKQKILTACVLFALCLGTIIITTQIGRTDIVRASIVEATTQPTSSSSLAQGSLYPEIPTTCALMPPRNPTISNQSTAITPGLVTLSRFRRLANGFTSSTGYPINQSSSAKTLADYTPKESIALADSTNYGERFVLDLSGRPAYYPPIVVLHETVGSASSAINLFQTPHFIESEQASYHTLINRNGEIIYLVPPDKRAFGAGNSVFTGENGAETVKTHPNYPPSVNNFAYHISLETPRDGNHNGNSHSGYTIPQYQSLAWLVAKTGVPSSRITTHKAVDRSGQRKDPRSFNQQTFFGLLQNLPKTQEIIIDCQPPSNPSGEFKIQNSKLKIEDPTDESGGLNLEKSS
jgi:hypothetical protein